MLLYCVGSKCVVLFNPLYSMVIVLRVIRTYTSKSHVLSFSQAVLAGTQAMHFTNKSTMKSGQFSANKISNLLSNLF